MQHIHFQDQKLNALISSDMSPWSESLKITQTMINDFAQLSGDTLWIHVDEERCKAESPLKSTIAHGFLTLSLLSKFKGNNLLEPITGYRQIFNYGSNKLRFMNPVTVNSSIRSRSRVKAVEVAEHKTTVTIENQIGIINDPSMDKEMLAMIYEMMIVMM